MNDRVSFIVGRALPIGVFGFLVAIQAELTLAAVQNAFHGNLDRTQAMYLLNRLLTLAFFGFLVVIYAIRSKAIAKNHNPVAIAAAMVGSFALYGLFLVPGWGRTTDIWVLGASDVLLAAGIGWALYSLSYLGGRFSIVPEARGLVTSGPYRLARHPIYLGEITAGFGLVLPTLFSPHAIVFAIFLGAQILRTYFEERVLRSTYPQYEAYARRTHRLIPFVL
jgi:protein-S-isoprenylcysteine O-methyltransferase Ste14